MFKHAWAFAFTNYRLTYYLVPSRCQTNLGNQEDDLLESRACTAFLDGGVDEQIMEELVLGAGGVDGGSLPLGFAKSSRVSQTVTKDDLIRAIDGSVSGSDTDDDVIVVPLRLETQGPANALLRIHF